MAQAQVQLTNSRQIDDADDSDEGSSRRNSSDGLEFVPTLLKVKQVVLLRHREFRRLVDEFNQTLQSFTRDEPHFLQFTIVPQSDSTFLWKALVRIRCQKVNSVEECSTNPFLLFRSDLSGRSKRDQ